MAEEKYVSKVVLSDGRVLMDLTTDTITESDVLKGKKAHGANGAPIVGTCEFDVDSSEATANESEVLVGKTFAKNGSIRTGSMPNIGGVEGAISTKDEPYIVPAGYHDGSGTVKIDETESEKLIPGNIKQGVNILGVDGTYSGVEDLKIRAGEATPNWETQTILPGEGYDYLSQVTVNPIPMTEADNASGGKTVTIG